MDEEWSKFKFVEPKEIDQIINDPLVMLPVLDEKVGRRIPQAFIHPVKDVEILRMRRYTLIDGHLIERPLL